jgi:PAS domain S-box-containing protein
MTTAPGSEMSQSEHFVQFCETDAFLINSVSEFIGTGLRAGDAGIVIATKPHRESLEERLKGDGLAIAAARARGQYVSIDAAATLSTFMVDGLPDPQRFAAVVESMITRATKGRSRVRIFGEMVALLWADGNRAAAISLEECWNDLARTHSFSLFCAYPIQGFGGEVYEVEFTEICKQHSRVIPAESYAALSSPDERLRAITLLQQKANSLEAEIAERKVVEKALRLSEIRYRRLFEAARDGVLILDPETRKILDANPFMEDLLSYPREELIGKELFEIGFLKDKPAAEAMFRELQVQNCIRYEESLETTTSRPQEIEVVANLYDEGERSIIQCNIRDITERKEIERRKDDFISIASHELKTPVTSLKGFAQVLQRRLKRQDDEESLRFLAIMDKQLNKLTKLINDLLDISKMRQGKLDYREDPFDLDALSQEIVENLQAGTSTHQLLIEGRTAVQVFGDRDRIGQVLINLLTNAIKYSPKADTVIVRVSKDQENAIVSVQDFGIGIAAAHHKQIFERFYQVTDPEEKTYPGLGTGLYICAAIIKRHHGQIWVESRKDQGSTFSFTLPLRERKESSFH